ncbi:hypothetical protein F4801DRAFT_598747 [Xylaria longipes]|nr:hypothetical protein F4801DRAFT_598747 [Xylaria longipes]
MASAWNEFPMIIYQGPNNNYETRYAFYVLTALTEVFGSIHAIAWNFEFPTFTEQILWRVATLISTAVPPLALLAIPLAQITELWGDSSNFRDTCLDVMREYSWHVNDNRPVQEGMKALREVCGSLQTNEHIHYRDILGESDDSEEFLGTKLLRYCHKGLYQGLEMCSDSTNNHLWAQGGSGSLVLSSSQVGDP